MQVFPTNSVPEQRNPPSEERGYHSLYRLHKVAPVFIFLPVNRGGCFHFDGGNHFSGSFRGGGYPSTSSGGLSFCGIDVFLFADRRGAFPFGGGGAAAEHRQAFAPFTTQPKNSALFGVRTPKRTDRSVLTVIIQKRPLLFLLPPGRYIPESHRRFQYNPPAWNSHTARSAVPPRSTEAVDS